MVKRAPAMSATWGNSAKIYSLGVLPPLTQTGPPPGDAERVAISRERLPTPEGFSAVVWFFEVDLPAHHPVAVRRLE